MLVEVGGEDDERRGGAWAGGFREAMQTPLPEIPIHQGQYHQQTPLPDIPSTPEPGVPAYALWEGVGCR